MTSATTIESVLNIMRSTKGILSIEGNIGVGKSTLLDLLKSSDYGSKKVVFMQEPVDQWSNVRNESGETILSCFYQDPAKYAFTFQVMAFTSRLATFKRVVKENPDCELIVCERSLEADRNIFAQMMRDQGSMEPMVYQVYEMLYAATALEFPVSNIVYLDASPATCLQRIAKRGRAGEAGIGLDYLETCKSYYDKWLSNRENVVCIDVN
jgi:deoxycitidine kinase/deoxyguanosine kinase